MCFPAFDLSIFNTSSLSLSWTMSWLEHRQKGHLWTNNRIFCKWNKRCLLCVLSSCSRSSVNVNLFSKAPTYSYYKTQLQLSKFHSSGTWSKELLANSWPRNRGVKSTRRDYMMSTIISGNHEFLKDNSDQTSLLSESITEVVCCNQNLTVTGKWLT